MPEEKIVIFTDGSSRGNPGPGGFAAIIIAPQNRDFQLPTPDFRLIELGGREEHTTNNRMELTAAIEALRRVGGLGRSDSEESSDSKRFRVQIYSDSSYVVNGITKWISSWQKNGWETKAKRPVENRDLWEMLAELTQNKKIDWRIIGGHVGVVGNERCDAIATAFADGAAPKLYSGPIDEYPVKNILDFSGDSFKGKIRSSARARLRARAYSYVSEVGGIVKIWKTWAECEAGVKGVAGARYKKALSAEEEAALVREFKK